MLWSGCGRRNREPAIGEGFVAAAQLNLYHELGPNEPVAAVASHGERLEILARRRKFVRVRNAAGVVGWADGDLLFTQEQMRELRELGRWAATLPVQGSATVLEPLNAHTSPSRAAPSLHQIQEGQSVAVVGHKLIVNGERAEDWSLVTLPGELAGWVLTRRLFMAIPDEVAQYAEGHRIMAYFPLGEVRDGKQSRQNWLWATITRGGQPYEFDSLRVFVWSLRRRRYETVFLRRNLTGYYPIEVSQEPDGGFRFCFTASEKKGPPERFIYRFKDQRVKLASRTPVAGPPVLEPPPLAPQPSPQPSSLLGRWMRHLEERFRWGENQ